MIQRIQTLYLLLVAICMLGVIFFPIWVKENKDTKEKVELNALTLTYTKGFKVVQETQTFYIAIVAGVILLVAVYAIFQYKNRVTQIKFTLLNTLLLCILLGVIVFFNYQGEAAFPEPKFGSYDIGFYIPAIALVFNMLARRSIKKDEDLVRSMDRMR